MIQQAEVETVAGWLRGAGRWCAVQQLFEVEVRSAVVGCSSPLLFHMEEVDNILLHLQEISDISATLAGINKPKHSIEGSDDEDDISPGSASGPSQDLQANINANANANTSTDTATDEIKAEQELEAKRKRRRDRIKQLDLEKLLSLKEVDPLKIYSNIERIVDFVDDEDSSDNEIPLAITEIEDQKGNTPN